MGRSVLNKAYWIYKTVKESGSVKFEDSVSIVGALFYILTFNITAIIKHYYIYFLLMFYLHNIAI